MTHAAVSDSPVIDAGGGHRARPRGASGRIRDLIDRGAPWEACDAFRAAVAAMPEDADLLFLGALAHARTGAIHEAYVLLDRAEPLARSAHARPQALGRADHREALAESAHAPDLLTDILSLRARLWKDLAHRTPEMAAALPFVERAREQYLAAYAITRDPFPGANAATLAFLAGRRDEARALAAEVIGSLSRARGTATAWELASLGEARLLAGDVEIARQCYADAHRACSANAGMVASMRRQLALLARVLPAALAMQDAIPQLSVIAFSGHLVDEPGRPTPRFPAALEAHVMASLREQVAALRAPVVYASAACGADLLCVEAALERDAEVNLVLPFDRDDFVRTSVAIAGDTWIPRFERALARAHRVVMATEERYLGDDALFDHAAREVEGFAILRAAQLETEPTMLCVADLGDVTRETPTGGTGAALARWRASGRKVDVIDLATLRGGSTPTVAGAPVTANSSRGGALGNPRSSVPRSIHSMLFADIAGYSRLRDAELPRFQRAFLDLAASLLNDAGTSPLEAKTWGDGLYVVFEEPEHAAEFALRFAKAMRGDEATAATERDSLAIRIALHAGAVFRMFDPVMRRDSHFGANVTRAARIEPVTPSGLVYASEAFAATLASGGTDAYVLEYVGVLALAKHYGESRIYRLERR